MVCVIKALTCGSTLGNLMPSAPLSTKIKVFLHLEERGSHFGFGDGDEFAGPGEGTQSLWNEMGWGSSR